MPIYLNFFTSSYRRITGLLAVLVAVIWMSSCSYKQYAVQRHDYQTYLPIQRSGDGKVSLYFDGDPFPNKPFVEGGELGVAQRRHQPSSLLAPALQKKARELGYDAVIDIQKIHEWREGYSFWDYVFLVDGEAVPSGVEYEILVGRGIKFVENIDYLDYQKKTQVALLEKSGVHDTLFTKTFYPDGEFKSINYHSDSAKRFHDQVIVAHDVHRLMEEEEGWDYTLDQYGRLYSRRHKRFDDWILEKVRFKYEGSTSRLKEMRVTLPSKTAHPDPVYSIFVTQDDLGRIVQKTVEQYEETRWIEDLTYDDNGRLSTSEIKRTHWTDKKLVVHYDYYKNSELSQLLTDMTEQQDSVSLTQ